MSAEEPTYIYAQAGEEAEAVSAEAAEAKAPETMEPEAMEALANQAASVTPVVEVRGLRFA